MRRFVVLLAAVVILTAGSVIPAASTQATSGSGDGALGLEQAGAANLLDTWLEAMRDYDRLPGMSVAVVHDEELIYAKGFGHADQENGIEATPGTVYRIASISKLFTSIAVMQLRDAGRLSLDDPISTHLTWFQPRMVSPDAPAPTIGDVLRHTSGLPCEPDMSFWDDPALLFPNREELIERASHVRMSYPTNTSHNYSNLGYALLGEIVSVVSGEEYADHVREHILEPLGMTATTPFPPADLDRGSEMARGYGRWPRVGPRGVTHGSAEKAMAPAGGFASNVLDLARFAMWQLNTLSGAGNGVLSPETLKEMQAEHWSDPAWGLGFEIYKLWDETFVGHMGGGHGYKSQFVLCPETGIAVIVMVNATDAPQFTLALRVYEVVKRALVDSAGGEARGEEDWEAYTGYYTADKTWSDAEVLEWEGSLAVMWVPTPDPLGSLEVLERVDGNTFRRVKGDGELGKHYVFGPDAEGDIVGMRFNNNILRKTDRPD